MIETMMLVARQVGTLFLMMGVGFLLARLKVLTDGGRAQMTAVLVNIAVPCIIIDSLQVPRTAQLVKAMSFGLLLLCLAYVIWVALTHLFFRKTEKNIQAVLRYGMIYGNNGFMGIPLVDSLLGPSGLIYATVAHVAFNIFAWSQGVAIMGGRKNVRLSRMFLNPGIIGCIVGLVFFLLDLRLPTMVGQAVHGFGAMNTPLAMLVIGAQMADSRQDEALKDGRLYVSSAVRQILFPSILLVLLLPLRLDPLMYAAFVILAATPCAGYVAIFAQRYGRDTGKAAQLVSLSTLLSILTLPVFATLAQLLPGLVG